jgi:hypothetical protein
MKMINIKGNIVVDIDETGLLKCSECKIDTNTEGIIKVNSKKMGFLTSIRSIFDNSISNKFNDQFQLNTTEINDISISNSSSLNAHPKNFSGDLNINLSNDSKFNLTDTGNFESLSAVVTDGSKCDLNNSEVNKLNVTASYNSKILNVFALKTFKVKTNQLSHISIKTKCGPIFEYNENEEIYHEL